MLVSYHVKADLNVIFDCAVMHVYSCVLAGFILFNVAGKGRAEKSPFYDLDYIGGKGDKF